MRILIGALVAAAFAAGSVAPSAVASAQADRPCVDRAEFAAASHATKRLQVQAALGGPGRTFRSSEAPAMGKGYLIRHYGVCGAPTDLALVIAIYYLPTDRVQSFQYMSYRPKYDNLLD